MVAPAAQRLSRLIRGWCMADHGEGEETVSEKKRSRSSLKWFLNSSGHAHFSRRSGPKKTSAFALTLMCATFADMVGALALICANLTEIVGALALMCAALAHMVGALALICTTLTVICAVLAHKVNA